MERIGRGASAAPAPGGGASNPVSASAAAGAVPNPYPERIVAARPMGTVSSAAGSTPAAATASGVATTIVAPTATAAGGSSHSAGATRPIPVPWRSQNASAAVGGMGRGAAIPAAFSMGSARLPQDGLGMSPMERILHSHPYIPYPHSKGHHRLDPENPFTGLFSKQKGVDDVDD